VSLFTDYLSLSGIFILIPIVLVYFGVRSVMKSMRRDKERERQADNAASHQNEGK